MKQLLLFLPFSRPFVLLDLQSVFSDPVDQDIRTRCVLNWKIVVSEWRSMIAVSLNVGGGVRLFKQAKFTCARKKEKKIQKERGR